MVDSITEYYSLVTLISLNYSYLGIARHIILLLYLHCIIIIIMMIDAEVVNNTYLFVYVAILGQF